MFEDQYSFSYYLFTGLSEIGQLLDSGEKVVSYSDDKKQFHNFFFVSNQGYSTVQCNKIERWNGDVYFNDKCDAILNDTILRRRQSFLSIEILKGEIKKYLHKCESFLNANGCHLFILQTDNVTIDKKWFHCIYCDQQHKDQIQ